MNTPPPEPTDDTPAPTPAVDAAPSPDAAPPMTSAQCTAELATRFPALFTPGQPRPVKLRIQADIQARAPGVFTKKGLSVFLHRHTTGNAYLKALVASPQRFDLDGAEAGEISEEHRQAAVTELARRRELSMARRAAERDAQRPAQRPPQRQPQGPRPARPPVQRTEHNAPRPAPSVEDVAARERQALLRAWETTTLTPANFLALKGLRQEELDAALAQARAQGAAAREPRGRDDRTERPSGSSGPRPPRGPRGGGSSG